MDKIISLLKFSQSSVCLSWLALPVWFSQKIESYVFVIVKVISDCNDDDSGGFVGLLNYWIKSSFRKVFPPAVCNLMHAQKVRCSRQLQLSTLYKVLEGAVYKSYKLYSVKLSQVLSSRITTRNDGLFQMLRKGNMSFSEMLQTNRLINATPNSYPISAEVMITMHF